MYEFTHFVDGDPRPKARPRLSRGRVFNPTSDHEKAVRYDINLAIANLPKELFPKTIPLFPEGPVGLYLSFYFMLPRSLSKAERERRMGNGAQHTQKPDLDNIVKAILDVGNGLLWTDDAQVSHISAGKRWGAKPGTLIVVKQNTGERP